MCHCEEERRSNLLHFAEFLLFNFIEIASFFLLVNGYFKEEIGSQITDCFVVPPRNDTLI
jgi:hypothetical protein